jgi:hypothetical protein
VPTRVIPTLVVIVVAVLFGAVPLRECRAFDGGGIVLAGDHAHDGGCCPESPPRPASCPCGHPHAPEPSRDSMPNDGHPPCCVDTAAPIFATLAVVGLPPAAVAAAVAQITEPILTCDARPGWRSSHGPDPGDGPPAGVLSVVLLR